MQIDWSTTILAALFAMLLLAVAHFLTRVLWDTLHRLTCYIIGMALILAVFAVWCSVTGDWGAFVALTAIVAGAGAGTVIGWLADWKGREREAERARLEALRLEVALMEKRVRDG